jgi:hypothetical protein
MEREVVLDDKEGNKMYAYKMAMNERVKINTEHLKTLDLLKYIPVELQLSPKKLPKKRKKDVQKKTAPRKIRRKVGTTHQSNEEEESDDDCLQDASRMTYYGVNCVVVTLAAHKKNKEVVFLNDSAGSIQWVNDEFVRTSYTGNNRQVYVHWCAWGKKLPVTDFEAHAYAIYVFIHKDGLKVYKPKKRKGQQK